MSNINLALAPSRIKEETVRCIRAGLVPIVRSPPAVGKSDVVRSIAKDFSLKLIDFRLSQADLTDLNGLPHFRADGRAEFAPFDDFPLETDDIPEGYNGWLMFFDELTSAHKDIQASAYKILLDRMVGKRKIHSKVAMVAAGNNVTDNAVAYEMSTALQSRLIHLDMGVDKNDWMEWAIQNGIDSRIIGFIEFKPTLLYNFDPNHTDHTFAAPRTWEFSSRLIKGHSVTMEDLPILSGTVGPGPAMEFISFTEVYSQLPKISEIVADPENAPLPNELSMRYALATHLADRADDTNLDAFIKYMDRLPVETSVVFMRIVSIRDRELLRHKGMQGLYTKLMDLL